MRVLVTGAGGMLGRAVMRRFDGAMGLARGDLDVTDREAAFAAVRDIRPELVINCAGYTDVDRAEADEQLATAVNGDGAGNVAAAAAAAGARVVHFSTDYVFDGEKREPYIESDEIGPRSAYGRSKLAGERSVARANERHLIVRTSWLFGEGGRNFVDTMLTLGSERGEVSVVADQVGCPTWTGHLAAAFPALLACGDGILHVAGSGRCSWYEFAVEIFRQAGLDVQVTPSSTAEFPRPAPRPTFSVLGSERGAPVLDDWQDGLRAYLSERVAAR
jgi:dTDP-4-dehydrorhamnose reductase